MGTQLPLLPTVKPCGNHSVGEHLGLQWGHCPETQKQPENTTEFDEENQAFPTTEKGKSLLDIPEQCVRETENRRENPIPRNLGVF